MWLLEKYRNIRRWYKRIYHHSYKVDLGLRPEISFLTKLKYNIIGFTDEDFLNFDLKNNDYHNYISYKERLRLENINGRFAPFLGEKIMFERIFRNYIHVPCIYCYKNERGQFVDLETGESISILDKLIDVKKMIAKPAKSAGGGQGVHLLEYKDGFYIDSIQKEETEALDFLGGLKGYIFVQYIESHHYSTEIFPYTANTIRVVSVMKFDGNVDFLFAYHRFGNNRSKPVDNISSGGLVAFADLESGTLEAAHSKTNPSAAYHNHPDTGAVIKGVRIPRWKDILKELDHVHRCFPFFKFFAWDVVIDQECQPWVLEINRGSDLTCQMCKPMRNDKMGKFMREEQLLDSW